MNMRTVITAVLLAIGCVWTCIAPAEEPDKAGALSSAGEILDSALARMPGEPMLITGRLKVQDRGHTILRSYNVEIMLHVEGDTLSGSYTLFDPKGASLERLKVVRRAGGKPAYEYAAGAPLMPAETPGISSAIRDTGVTWADLSMPFLWWRRGVMAGSESIRGQDCFVIDIQPDSKDGVEASVAVVRVWIAKKHRMLMQAEEYGAKAKMMRRLAVDSFGKINDEWMVKDIVVSGSTNLPAGYKSILTIKEIRSLGSAPATP
ncbi:MAG: outer membrane lipoprotein-sorting protein [bacterium]